MIEKKKNRRNYDKENESERRKRNELKSVFEIKWNSKKNHLSVVPYPVSNATWLQEMTYKEYEERMPSTKKKLVWKILQCLRQISRSLPQCKKKEMTENDKKFKNEHEKNRLMNITTRLEELNTKKTIEGKI